MKQYTGTKTMENDFEKDENLNFIALSVGVRYWEDSDVNGKPDTNGMIPFRKGDRWEPVIDVTTGYVIDWPNGVTAKIHYKVCDDGIYTLMNEKKEEIDRIESYVPSCLSIDDDGFGDYIILTIGDDGFIKNWKLTEEDVDSIYENQF